MFIWSVKFLIGSESECWILLLEKLRRLAILFVVFELLWSLESLLSSSESKITVVLSKVSFTICMELFLYSLALAYHLSTFLISVFVKQRVSIFSASSRKFLYKILKQVFSLRNSAFRAVKFFFFQLLRLYQFLKIICKFNNLIKSSFEKRYNFSFCFIPFTQRFIIFFWIFFLDYNKGKLNFNS